MTFLFTSPLVGLPAVGRNPGYVQLSTNSDGSSAFSPEKINKNVALNRRKASLLYSLLSRNRYNDGPRSKRLKTKMICGQEQKYCYVQDIKVIKQKLLYTRMNLGAWELAPN